MEELLSEGSSHVLRVMWFCKPGSEWSIQATSGYIIYIYTYIYIYKYIYIYIYIIQGNTCDSSNEWLPCSKNSVQYIGSEYHNAVSHS